MAVILRSLVQIRFEGRSFDFLHATSGSWNTVQFSSEMFVYCRIDSTDKRVYFMVSSDTILGREPP